MFVPDGVVPAFRAAGFVDDAELVRQRLLLQDGTLSPKLHVTLLNTKLRRSGGPAPVVVLAKPSRVKSAAEAALAEGAPEEEDSEAGGGYVDRVPLDARPLLARWGEAHIADAPFSQVHLSARGKFAPGGYYRSVEVLKWAS